MIKSGKIGLKKKDEDFEDVDFEDKSTWDEY